MGRLISATAGLVVALAMSACSPAAEEAQTPAMPTPAPEATPTAPMQDAAPISLETACRQAVETSYGQVGEAVSFEAGSATVSWRAPVDGGRLSFTCTVDGGAVTLTRDGQTQVVTLNTSADETAQQEAH